MAYIEWWNRTGPVTLGERFGLNEISIARETLSPIKSYTEGGRIGFDKGGPLRNIVQTDSGKYNIKYTVDGVLTTYPVEPNTLAKAKEIRNKLEAAKGGFYKPTGLEKFTEGPTADARKILDKLSKGSLVDRAAIIDKTGIDSSRLTKVLKEYKNKNFTFPEGTSKKGQVYTKATAAEEAIAQKVYGKTWEKLTVAQRGSIRAGHATGVTGGTPIIPGTSEQNKIAKKVYNKPFNELTTAQKSAIRVGKITEFSKPGPTKLDVINDLKKLVKNEDVLKFIKEGDMSRGKRDTIIKKIARFLNLPETLAARRIVYLSDAYLGNDFHIKVKNAELAKGAKKIAEYIDKQGFAALGYDIRRKTAETEVSKSMGEKSTFLETSREKIGRKLPARIFTDEVKNVISSAKAKSGAYSFFVQGLDKNVNLAKAGAVDSLTKTFELELQSIKKSDPNYHIKREALAKKYNTAVKNFVQKTNANLKSTELPVKAFEVSFKHPSESITRYKEISKKYPNIIEGVDDVFDKHGYSFKVPKDVRTVYEAKNLVESSRAVNLIKKKATAGHSRVFSKVVGPALWGWIGDISLKEMAHGKPSGETLFDLVALGGAWRKGKKRLISSEEENQAYDRNRILTMYENAKDGSSGMRSNLMSMVVGAAKNDPDFKGQPGEYIEWLKFKVREPNQMTLALEREQKTEERLQVTEEQKAAAKRRYKAWSLFPPVRTAKEMFKMATQSDEEKEKEKTETLESLLNV